MNFNLTKILIVFLLMLSFVSCLKPVKYPNEPIIEYVSFDQLDSSSAKLTFSFTDGDGDIGLEQEDVYPPYDSGSFYHYNVYINYFEMMDGEWVRGKSNPPYYNNLDNNSSNDTISFKFRLKNITPNGQNKALKGNVELTIEPQFFNPNSVDDNDTIMYKILLLDRSLNHSNLISTPPIVLDL